MKSRSSLSRAAAGRRREWTDRSLPRHLRLSFRLGQAHRERRPQPPIAYSQLQAPHGLLLGLALGGAPGDVLPRPGIASKAVERYHVQRAVGVAVASWVEAVADHLSGGGRHGGRPAQVGEGGL